MKTFRLLNTTAWAVEVFEVGHAPPYLAVSHAWSDRIFPRQLPLAPSFGADAIQQTILQPSLLPQEVRHCWVDLFCILQDSEDDMCEQIPLMGRIYGDATAVLIVLTVKLDLTQTHIDHGAAELAGALQVWRDESWTEDAAHRRWARGPGRAALVRAMQALTRFTSAAWGTRVWTLQEYLLAADVLWIGAELTPLRVPDELFAALPRLCEELDIRECILVGEDADRGRYELLFSHFAGMAARRTGAVDRTRVMEMLGNRRAFLPVDEVYGAMAVSTVEIAVRPAGESRESAWRRWTEAALRAGHLRWLLVPPAMATADDDDDDDGASGSLTCAEVLCSRRHVLSSASGLDTVTPYAPVSVSDPEGTVTLTARPVGPCTILRPLGPVHRSDKGWVHRDLTLILYSGGAWSSAVEVALAFGAGRYSRKQLLMIAQTLVNNYDRALRFVARRTEARFYPVLQSERYARVWADLMQLQSRCVMDALNFGFGFLVRVDGLGVPFLTVLVTNGRRSRGELVAFDCNARGTDGRHKLLVGERVAADERGRSPGKAAAPWHKAGVTISVGEDYAWGWDAIPLVEISIGGSGCLVCKEARAHDSRTQTHIRTRRPGRDEVRAIHRRLQKRRRENDRRSRINKFVRSRAKRRHRMLSGWGVTK